MPVEGILRLEYPVVLVGEDDQFRGNSHHLGGVECCHSLLVGDTEVHSPMYAEYGRVPLGHHR